MKRVGFEYRGKKIFIEARECSFFGRFRGLMFRSLESSEVLLFDFGRPVRYSIHSLFVRFPFVGVWIDSKGRVVMIKRVEKKVINLRPRKFFSKLIEIPVKKEYSSILKLLDED